MPTISAVAAREIVHLLILRELAGIRRGTGITVKGGVNLRLFFGSVRYSEDMDLDGTDPASEAIRRWLTDMFENTAFTRRLQAFGIRGLDPGEGPNKDTETTFRYKFGVIVPGGIWYSTKVEVSFRSRHAGDRAVLEPPAAEIPKSYGLDVFDVRHYVKEAAIRQKLDALGGRREVQARDVFDLHVLVPEPVSEKLVTLLAKQLDADRLKEAQARALIPSPRALNPQAPMKRAVNGEIDLAFLVGVGLANTRSRLEDVERWMGADAHDGDHAHAQVHAPGSALARRGARRDRRGESWTHAEAPLAGERGEGSAGEGNDSPSHRPSPSPSRTISSGSPASPRGSPCRPRSRGGVSARKAHVRVPKAPHRFRDSRARPYCRLEACSAQAPAGRSPGEARRRAHRAPNDRARPGRVLRPTMFL